MECPLAVVKQSSSSSAQADSEDSNAGSSGSTGPNDVVLGVPVARVKRRARNAPEAIVVPVAEEQDVTAMLGAPQLRRASSRRAIATPPTDMGMPETQFREELHAYLMSKAPEMQADEVSTFVAKVDTDEQSRAALNEELHQTHGQSLDDFYIERVRQQAASLRAALREAGAGTAYPVLLEHGIESIEALQDVDPALLTEMFPDPELHAAVAQLSNPL
ncbi:Hypothetical Protein FCC1311_084572 [Hondaea fermentalgiana]|uniref:Uncharacterized protein n=1 Tax=Hondaea fermentalgiana TaxID=2315210 RepID=A0A2R5GMV6_9STRA|nr:Hypothetical Protein FCC1311_084572 [Hondaea fermentalgiana]|eukprot:GBG32232.1 Hypothetical Protein FCC1311_084572 [Hondaea fermentalgiana]